ncbi:MAG: hypothetical protein DWH91_19600 [Planctomycetota bacterium]|nr:MAG: hypothetical protein DWH91_19600 [Planctomycetota bacterium]
MWNPVSRSFGLWNPVAWDKFRNAGSTLLCLLCFVYGLSGSNGVYAQGPGFPQPGGFGPPSGDGGRGDRGDRGGRGGFDPSEMIRRMDADQNGLITANEVERVPSFVRDRWQQQGLDFSRGVKVDEMAQNAQRQMDDFRRQREESDRDRERERERSDRPEFQPPPEAGRESRSPSPSSTSTSSKPRSRIVPLLSDSYKAIDTDYDGQIALYEWRKARKGTFSQFAASDLDNDGFLTARELAKGTAAAPASADPATAARPSQTASPPPAAPIAAATPPAPVTVSVDQATAAARMFELLDEDKSGTVLDREWDKSRRLKPLFEKAGINLKEPLTKEQFAQWYVRSGADRQ